MNSFIAQQIDLRQIERDFRAECKPIVDEIVRVQRYGSEADVLS